MVSYRKLKNVLISAFIIPIYFILYTKIGDMLAHGWDEDVAIYVFSLLGVIQFAYCAVQWRKMSGNWFSKQFLFLIFLYMFNFGQCFMWAFGVHAEGEISTSNFLYYTISIDAQVICQSQLLVLIMAWMLNLGMLCVYKRPAQPEPVSEAHTAPAVSVQTPIERQYLQISLLLSVVIFACSLYCTLQSIAISREHGYAANYYGEYAYSTNTIIVLLGMMSFSSVMSILIFNRDQNRRVTLYAYGFFILSACIGFFSGDRGFVYTAMILIFWRLQTKGFKLRPLKLVLILVVGYGALALLTSVKEVRSSAFTLSDLLAVAAGGESPIASTFFEMGGSMSPLVRLVKAGYNPYPYGNTFLFTLLGMISENIISFFGIPYKSLSTWFSFDYLGITSGAGFSLFAELYMNFGAYFGSAMALVFGCIFGKGISYNKGGAMGELFSVTALAAFITVVRNTFQNGMKNFFYTVIIYMLMLWVIRMILNIGKHNS